MAYLTYCAARLHNITLCCLLFSVCFITNNASANTYPAIVGMRCEYLTNPIGIDAKHPRLSWKLNDASTGAKQLAYQLFVSTDSIELKSGKGNIWQTKKLVVDSCLITFNGKALQPFTTYYWCVIVWDKNQTVPIKSSIASFEMGMMEMSNWKGSWISDDKDARANPTPYFRDSFHIRKQIKFARAYIAVAGLYELSINGQKIGNHRLDPMYTRFDKRTLYVTHDVTAQVQNGENAIGVLLGNGWYNLHSTAVWDFDKAPWRNRPAFCFDLRITYVDGTVETVRSSKQWRTSFSPIIFNSIYTAEHYDARLEQPGWDKPGFIDSTWTHVINRSAPSANIVAQAMEPIRTVETIPAISINHFNDTNYVFDIGRNISGVSRITVKGDSGTVIRLKHAERLYKQTGHADQSNIDIHYRPTDDKDPFATDIFILSGRAEETFMPRFNYKGFQYVEVTSSKPVTLTKASLTAYFMHSDVAPIGQVSSSNPTLDKIWLATNNAYLSNFFGYPTDCPQREKNGWTGDAHIASETGLYSFDGFTVYEKWMADHRDEQQPNGVLPSIIPTDGWGYEWGNGPDWTSTIAIIPWNLYLFYGDKKPIADNYENIKRYVNHIDDLYPTGLTTWGLGDWVPVKSVSPVELTSSAYYFADVAILTKIAGILHNTADETKYKKLAIKIKDAINTKYLDAATGIYDKGYQTELSVPLFWGLVPDNLKTKVAANLAARVKEDNYHLDAGILGAKAILSALSDNGQAEVAYAIAAQETYPSWGWWIVNGATTLYENWNIDAGSDISLNHIMFGEIGAWLYKGIGGIKPDPQSPGFKNVLLTPNFIEKLQHYESAHDGPFGKIISAWKRVNGNIEYNITIPANSTATILFPVVGSKNIYQHGKIISIKNIINVPSGTYQFIIK